MASRCVRTWRNTTDQYRHGNTSVWLSEAQSLLGMKGRAILSTQQKSMDEAVNEWRSTLLVWDTTQQQSAPGLR